VNNHFEDWNLSTAAEMDVYRRNKEFGFKN